jgi:hypothetical protein
MLLIKNTQPYIGHEEPEICEIPMFISCLKFGLLFVTKSIFECFSEGSTTKLSSYGKEVS